MEPLIPGNLPPPALAILPPPDGVERGLDLEVATRGLQALFPEQDGNPCLSTRLPPSS